MLPPLPASPHAATLPSCINAAYEKRVDASEMTGSEKTGAAIIGVVLPPYAGAPQAATEPVLVIAAKA